jgi:hypothetical protein
MASRPRSSAPSRPAAPGAKGEPEFDPTRAAPSRQGFGEAPQRGLEGAPFSSGSVSDWAKEMERMAEAETIETRHDVASKAGKHRKKVEIAASKAGAPRQRRAKRREA